MQTVVGFIFKTFMRFKSLYVENEFASRKAAKDAEKNEISHGHTQKKKRFSFQGIDKAPTH